MAKIEYQADDWLSLSGLVWLAVLFESELQIFGSLAEAGIPTSSSQVV